MKHYTIQITDKALADMEEIYNYIAIQLQAPENAMGQYNRIAEAIEGLCCFSRKNKTYGVRAGKDNGFTTISDR